MAFVLLSRKAQQFESHHVEPMPHYLGFQRGETLTFFFSKDAVGSHGDDVLSDASRACGKNGIAGQRIRWIKAHLKQAYVDNGRITAEDLHGSTFPRAQNQVKEHMSNPNQKPENALDLDTKIAWCRILKRNKICRQAYSPNRHDFIT
eukprot:432285-Amphidinium_carterae.1